MRSSGILLHISSLPSPCGIGTLGEEARRFVDFLARAGCCTGRCCPSGQSATAIHPSVLLILAGNPYFIDLPTLQAQGLLEAWEYEQEHWGTTRGRWITRRSTRPPPGARPRLRSCKAECRAR
jgi:4-alpha-glucanotransferase